MISKIQDTRPEPGANLITGTPKRYKDQPFSSGILNSTRGEQKCQNIDIGAKHCALGTIRISNQDSEYEISGWVKTLNVQDPSEQWWITGAKIGVYGSDFYLAAASPGINNTQDWTYVTTKFITGRTTIAKVTCTLGEADLLYSRSTSSGTMWCDDLTLTKIRTLSRTKITGTHVALDVYTEDYGS